MKKILLSLACIMPMMAFGQYTFDALKMSGTDLRGTSRFVSMAGAFGALGGDISSIGQNPGGLGVYRSSDISITASWDFMSSAPEGVSSINHNKVIFNNVGYAGSMKMQSDVLKYLNWGISFNRNKTFNRHYMGGIDGIPTTFTDFIADHLEGTPSSDIVMRSEYDSAPFENSGSTYGILGYNCNVVFPYTSDGKSYTGLGARDASGYAEYEVDEWGYADEYNISLGGNIADFLFWGASVGFNNLDYHYYNYYGEDIQNTEVLDNSGDYATVVKGNANYGLVNNSRTTGDGFNFKLGVILKPVNAIRFGLAFHTPTYYRLTDVYDTNMKSEIYGDNIIESGNHYILKYSSPVGEVHYKLNTPWRYIASVAGVIGNKGIVSLDYEYVDNSSMRLKETNGENFAGSVNEMKTYLKPTHIVRLGAEYRIDSNWSLRAGYSYQTSQVEKCVENADTYVVASGSNPAYSYDKSVNNITCGLGYHKGHFYFDVAYMHQKRNSNYHAFSPIEYVDDRGVKMIDSGIYTGVTDKNNRIQCTLGVRF